MTELDLPDPTLEPVPLGLDRRTTLGTKGGTPDAPRDRVSLGRPACIALDVATVDAQARVFLEGKPESSFWLLALTCSFRAVDDEPIEKAWLEVRLQTTTPDGAQPPTAWSMEPLALSDRLQVSKQAKLDASLKLTSPVIPLEIGPSASSETTKTYEREVRYVEAYREGTARPSWIFSRTPITDVRGVHRLRAVIELAAGTTARAEISAGATLRLKLLGLVPYRAELDDLPEHESLIFGR